MKVTMDFFSPIKAYRKWRDRRFLKRLERVLNENVLSADILFSGRVGGIYDFIYEDSLRGYNILRGFADLPNQGFPKSPVPASGINPKPSGIVSKARSSLKRKS